MFGDHNGIVWDTPACHGSAAKVHLFFYPGQQRVQQIFFFRFGHGNSDRKFVYAKEHWLITPDTRSQNQRLKTNTVVPADILHVVERCSKKCEWNVTIWTTIFRFWKRAFQNKMIGTKIWQANRNRRITNLSWMAAEFGRCQGTHSLMSKKWQNGRAERSQILGITYELGNNKITESSQIKSIIYDLSVFLRRIRNGT